MPREALSAIETAAACGVADLRAFLEGAWLLGRAIDDRRRGRRGRFAGRAAFAPEGADLVYREQGRLRLPGFETVATRVYRYTFPAPQLAEVRFQDGRLFHNLDLSDGVWAAEHRCGDDLYRGTFRVAGHGCWTAAWRITGPAKDQILESVYRRPG